MDPDSGLVIFWLLPSFFWPQAITYSLYLLKAYYTLRKSNVKNFSGIKSRDPNDSE